MYFVLFTLLCCSRLVLSQPGRGFFDEAAESKSNQKLLSGFFSAEDEALEKYTSLHVKNDPESDRYNEKVPDAIDSLSKRDDESNLPTNNVGPTSKELLTKAYFTRFLHIFLRSTGLEEYNAEEDEGKTLTVDVKLSKRDLNVLKNFGSGGDVTFEALERSFTSIFSHVKEIPDISNSEPFFVTSDLFCLFKYFVLIGSGVAVVLYCLYISIRYNLNKALIMLTAYVAYMSIVSLDLLQQYEDISEQIILRRMEFENFSNPPKECFLSKMQITDKLYYHLFGGNDICERFLESRKSVFYQMDVFSAFCKPISSLILKSISLLGEGSEKIIKPFIDKCPWPLNVVLYPILSILLLPLVIGSLCLLISVYYFGKISFKLPFFSITSERTNNYEKLTPKEQFTSGVSKDNQPAVQIINQGGIVLLPGKKGLGAKSWAVRDFKFQLDQASGKNKQDVCSELSKATSSTTNFHYLKKIYSKGGFMKNAFNKNGKLPALKSTSSASEKCGHLNAEATNSLVQKSSQQKAFKKRIKWRNITNESIKDLMEPMTE